MNLSRLFAPDEGRDGLRTLAGLLLGLGFFMAFARKSGGLGGGWSDPGGRGEEVYGAEEAVLRGCRGEGIPDEGGVLPRDSKEG